MIYCQLCPDNQKLDVISSSLISTSDGCGKNQWKKTINGLNQKQTSTSDLMSASIALFETKSNQQLEKFGINDIILIKVYRCNVVSFKILGIVCNISINALLH